MCHKRNIEGAKRRVKRKIEFSYAGERAVTAEVLLLQNSKGRKQRIRAAGFC